MFRIHRRQFQAKAREKPGKHRYTLRTDLSRSIAKLNADVHVQQQPAYRLVSNISNLQLHPSNDQRREHTRAKKQNRS
jgi:hypothetical protein